MTDIALAYRKKLLLLYIERASNGGFLSSEIEAQRTAGLDNLWQQMTLEEQNAAEQWYKAPRGSDNLNFVDVAVMPGDKHLPRILG